MKKRILKTGAFITALVLLLGVAWMANGLVGNPVSKMLATNTAKKHLAEHYGERDFVLDGVVFSFKFGHYHAYISSPSSEDSSFTLTIGLDGKLIQDDYEDRVLTGWNTAERIGWAYRMTVDGVLNSPSFPYQTDIGYGELEFVPKAYRDDPLTPPYALVTEELVLDAFYNVNELGVKAGKLTLYLYEDTVSVERLSAILLDLRRIFDDAGVSFYVVDCVLEYPKTVTGYPKEGRVEVMDFRYADIYADGMTERVQASNDAANAYYDQQDAEKFKEMEKYK